MKRAVVLGGGGIVGIAWETGIAAGLREAGVDLSQADLFVGTSAGSVVGTHLAAGIDALGVLTAAGQRTPAGGAPGSSEPPPDLAEVFALWTGLAEMTEEAARKIGALALRARTVPEAAWLATIEPLVGTGEWPERRLLLTAVETASGKCTVWEGGSGVPLHLAVASSCAVPGLMPPVTIGGGRYMDGGVNSGTNAHLAAGCERVLVIAPILSGTQGLGILASRQLEREVAGLTAGGSTVTVVEPDPRALEAFGPNLMDAARVLPALQAGWRQGAAAAGSLRKVWA